LGSFYCQIPNRRPGQLEQENADSDGQTQRNGHVVTLSDSEVSRFAEMGRCIASIEVAPIFAIPIQATVEDSAF
jgi:hypothetical protein